MSRSPAVLTPGPDDTSQIASREYAARTIEPGSIVRGRECAAPERDAPSKSKVWRNSFNLWGANL